MFPAPSPVQAPWGVAHSWYFWNDDLLVLCEPVSQGGGACLSKFITVNAQCLIGFGVRHRCATLRARATLVWPLPRRL